MRKIIISLAIILAVAAVGFGVTRAFFSDVETSTGNTFTAGSLDLKVDSQCSYNGQTQNCAGQWGQAANGLDIVDQRFFDFSDIKPGDTGENTISLFVDNNPAWACATITITKDDDMTCTEPELGDDSTCVEPDSDIWDGEMAKNLSLAWWADNGDNVLEANETNTLFFLSGAKLATLLNGGKVLNLTLADKLQNFFKNSHADGQPLSGDVKYYVGLAWCFGDMNINGTTISCNGALANNESQSDSLTADLSFYAVQHRNNPDFRCTDTYR